MKVIVTGHTRGLGAEIATTYKNLGHEVIGFSRSNGYDLRNWAHMQKMLDQVQDGDWFFNVAKPDFVQTTILYELWKKWQDQNKTIVNISSGITAIPTLPPGMFNDANLDLYRTAKMSLNEASRQLAFKAMYPKILLVNPQHLYGNPITEQEQVKLSKWTSTLIKVISEIDANGFTLKEITF